jgi:hypothetical protein
MANGATLREPAATLLPYPHEQTILVVGAYFDVTASGKGILIHLVSGSADRVTSGFVQNRVVGIAASGCVDDKPHRVIVEPLQIRRIARVEYCGCHLYAHPVM